MSISTMYGNPAGWHVVFTESWAVVVPQFILAPIDAALPGGNPLDIGDAPYMRYIYIKPEYVRLDL